jgi:hypothetical protein
VENPIISSVIARAVNVPLQHPVRTSVVATSPLVLIDMVTDCGVTGRGIHVAASNQLTNERT